jgi:hypothetical protein
MSKKKGKAENGNMREKLILKPIDLKHTKLVSELDDEKIHWLNSRHKSLKMKINPVIVYTKNSKNIWFHKIYISPDLEQNWEAFLELYRLRFRIEFLYRDAKQFSLSMDKMS